jgi:hypothetical protein
VAVAVAIIVFVFSSMRIFRAEVATEPGGETQTSQGSSGSSGTGGNTTTVEPCVVVEGEESPDPNCGTTTNNNTGNTGNTSNNTTSNSTSNSTTNSNTNSNTTNSTTGNTSGSTTGSGTTNNTQPGSTGTGSGSTNTGTAPSTNGTDVQLGDTTDTAGASKQETTLGSGVFSTGGGTLWPILLFPLLLLDVLILILVADTRKRVKKLQESSTTLHDMNDPAQPIASQVPPAPVAATQPLEEVVVQDPPATLVDENVVLGTNQPPSTPPPTIQ